MRRLGIMTHRIDPIERFLSYEKVGKEEGFEEIIIFTPERVDLLQQRIDGYIFSNGSWKHVHRPFPTISIDIGYYIGQPQIRTVQKVKGTKQIPFVGYGLGNKWTIQQHLKRSSQISPYLLPTEIVSHPRNILEMVTKYRSIMIKPINGKGGKGILRLTKQDQHYILEETQTGITKSLNLHQLSQVLNKILTSGKYIAQKWIDIRDRDGQVFDIRVLVQKNQYGRWQLTGMGVRQATREKITSNLTGGGKAYPVTPYLSQQFGEEKSQELIHQLEGLSYTIPIHLEHSYKKRLVELGLDLAVDRSGAIWVIEVNIKPGRTLWKKIGLLEAADSSLRAPVQYARYLISSKS